MIGTQLGPYQISEEIGRGGMATVYRAHQTSVGRDVALKTLQKNIGGDEQAVLRFQREARLVARLEHPHILPVYDFDGANDPPYIVMRLLEGGSLKEALSYQSLPAAEAVYLLRQIASALDYAHRQGVVHRDIKPSNILFDQEGNPFVADFGIARLTGGPSGLTGAGALIGTPDYIPPEQVSGQDIIDHRADIYSLGVMAYQILAGRLPFVSDNPITVIMAHLSQPLPDIFQFNPSLPEAVQPVLARALAKASQERYARAGEFCDALIAAVGSRVEPARLKILRRPVGRSTTSGGTPERPLAGSSQATPAEQNRPVTALFLDAAPFSQQLEDVKGPEFSRQAMLAWWPPAERIIGERGGTLIERTQRDLLALWGVEKAVENDAEQAVFAALELQELLREQCRRMLKGEFSEADLPLDIGIHTGMALLVRDAERGVTSASGASIGLTQRLAQQGPGQILITRETFRAVQGVFTIVPADTLRLRGRREPLEVFRVTSAKQRAFRVQVRGVEGVDTRLVGRETELKILEEAYLDAAEEGETQAVTIVSEAGLGKSRLVSEFDQWAELRPEHYRIFRGRANPAMTVKPYALLRDLFSFRFGILDNDSPAALQGKLENGVQELIGCADPEMAHLLGHLCGFDLSASPHVSGLKDDPRQLSARARQLALRFFEKASDRETLVLEIEDIHYADDASLDLLHQLPVEFPRLHLTLIMLARPALLARRPDWGSSHHQIVTLTPLSRRASRELVQEILKKAGDVPKELRDSLVERGEGNPFYIEELIKMLIEDRVITKESADTWRIETTRAGKLTVPSTLMGVLQARFDSLVYPEKVALQRAAVVGRIFYNTAIKALDDFTPAFSPGATTASAPPGDDLRLGEDIAGILNNLERRGFIHLRPDSAFAGSVEYMFTQSMQRDQIYETLLERQRAAYHAGIAAWTAQAAGERAAEYRPLIAEHYEKAGQLEKAAIYLCQAGQAALALSATADARRLLERSLNLMPETTGEERLPASLSLGECLLLLGDYNEASKVLDEALTNAQAHRAAGAQAQALYLLSQIGVRRGDWEVALRYLALALPLAEQAGDQTALGWTMYGLADVHYRTGQLEPARAYAQGALDLARSAGNGAIERNAMNRLGTILTSIYPPGSPERKQSNRILEEVHQKALAAGDRMIALAAMVNVTLNIEAEDDERIFQYTHSALELAREINLPVGIIVSALNLTEGYIRRKEIEQARQLLLEATKTAVRIGSETWLVGCALNIGYYRALTSDLAAGLGLVGAVLKHPAAGHDIHLHLQNNLAHVVQGRLHPAEIEAAMQAGRGQDIHAAVMIFLKENS